MKRKITRFVSGIAPTIFVNFAFRKLTSPKVYKLRPHEVDVLDKAEKSDFEFQGAKIQVYEWEAGPKKVLLVHGWEGQAGNFANIITRLIAENYSVIAFDGPSHGMSSKTGGTSLFEFAELVGVVIEKYNIKQIVSHSFGGVATMFSLAQNPSLAIDNYILLTTPNKFLDRIDTVAEEVGISNRVKKRLVDRLELELQMDLSKISVASLSKKVNVKNALILHDEFDKVLRFQESQAVNDVWAASNLELIHGTGHFKILKAEFVHNRIISFLKS